MSDTPYLDALLAQRDRIRLANMSDSSWLRSRLADSSMPPAPSLAQRKARHAARVAAATGSPAQSFTRALGAARGQAGSHLGSYPAPAEHTPESLHPALTPVQPSGHTREYTRTEHDRSGRSHLEHVMAYDRDSRAIQAHLALHHPGVYRYLQEGRDLSELDEMHHTDHERHVHIGHDYEVPESLEHPQDIQIGDTSRIDTHGDYEGFR